MAEATLVARWKGVVDPSVKKAADNVADASEHASKRSTAIWAGFGSAVGTLIGQGLAVAAGKAKDFIQDSFRAASDLKESVNVTELTYGKHAAKLDAFFKSAAGSIGMSETAARESASSVGGLLQNMGMGQAETAEWSKKLLRLSADMGSAFNADPADAIAAIGAGLRGEAEPLRRYNVMLSDSAIKAEAMKMGLYRGKGEITASAKAQASLALITKQTSRVQGDFANTSEGAANAARIQAAKVEDLKAKVGNGLLPIQEKWLALVNDKLIPGLSGAVDGLKGFGEWIVKNKGAIAGTTTTLAVLAAGFGAASIASKAMAAGGLATWLLNVAKGTKAWAIGQGILNAVMNANPIVRVVTIILALAAGLVIAYRESEAFRKVCDTAFKAIGDAGKWLWNNALQPAIKAIVQGFAWVVDGLAGMLEALGNIPGFEWAKTAAEGLRGIARSAREAADGLKKIPDETKPTVSLRNMATAEINKVKSQIAALKNKQVIAKAKGDATEVVALQRKIDALKSKQVTLTVFQRLTTISGAANRQMKISMLADGGIRQRENHVAQIARGGDYRIWAEDETGGESYIPLAPSKRARSRRIWWETGRRLGTVAMADGAVIGGETAPAGVDALLDVLVRLADRVLTVDDMERLMMAMIRAQGKPRPIAAVSL